jgi:hypothetical protein
MRRTASTIIALAIVLTGCDVEGSLGPRASLQLRQAERQWERQQLSNYDYDFLRLCFCENVAELHVRVRSGVVVSAERVADGVALPQAELADIPTVEGLFDIAKTAVAEADEVTVEYDPTLGYPRDISVDWYAGAIDDEESYLARNLEPAP